MMDIWEPCSFWDGLVLWLRMDEKTGQTAFDHSVYSNHGTAYGATPTGLGWVFDGENDYVTCGNDGNLSYLSGITIELWVKNASITTAGQNLIKTSSPSVWVLHYRGAGFYLRAEDGAASGYLGWDTTLSSGVWLHLAATWDGSTMKLYINGEKQTTERSFDGGTTGRLGALEEFSIGKYVNDMQPWFNGIVAELRIYNRALSPEEIELSYDLNKGLFS